MESEKLDLVTRNKWYLVGQTNKPKIKLTVAFVHDAFDGDQTAVHQGSHLSRDGAWNMSNLRLPDVFHLYRIAVSFDNQQTAYEMQWYFHLSNGLCGSLTSLISSPGPTRPACKKLIG
jgi:hypothetical protein